MARREHGGTRRREVLGAVRRAQAPLGVAEVAAEIGVHPNTARFHLDALVAEGVIERIPEEPSGPGRPRTVYALRPGMERGGARSYRLLAEILASYLAATAPDTTAAATDAGRAWGRYLVDRPPPFREITGDEAVRRLVDLLADLRFEPEWVRGDGEAPGRIRLRHCPFLELAEAHSEVVCPVHLGLMQGALAELKAPVTTTRLEPFAEVDACVAHLATAATA